MTPAQETKLNTATTWIPLAQFIAALLFCCGLVWWVSNERNEIRSDITQVSNDVARVTKLVENLAESFNRPNSLAFSRQDFIMDCLRFQIANPSWRCPYADASSSHNKSTQ